MVCPWHEAGTKEELRIMIISLEKKGETMKKALSLVLVLAIASAASAVITPEFQSGGSNYVEVEPGDVITVDFSYTGDATFMTITYVIDTASTQGTVSDGVVNPGFDDPSFSMIGGLNGADYLIWYVNGKTEGLPVPSPPVTGDLFSFDYEVSGLLPLDEEFTIGLRGTSFVELGKEGVTEVRDPAGVGPLTLKVVPEPATMLLLGIGGLLLRRRK